jgi:acyl-CoA dehydrogenase family member 9
MEIVHRNPHATRHQPGLVGKSRGRGVAPPTLRGPGDTRDELADTDAPRLSRYKPRAAGGFMVDTSISFMRSLCMGVIEEQVILPFPKVQEDQRETLRGVIDAINQLLGGREHDFRKWDREGELPKEFIEELKQFGLFGLVIPEEYGGMGFKSTAYSRTLQEIAKHDASVAVTIGAHSSIGMRGLLLYGTEEQRQKYYPKLATGEMIAAFCLTEPGAGSDAAAIKTRAIKQGDQWLLNGNKLWITNGGIADFFTVFAKTGEDQGRPHITTFIVTRDMPGVSVGPHEDKMGIRASSTTTVHFDNVSVPDANVLGPVDKGFKVAMHILNSGRTGLGGGSIGGMKRLIELGTKYANERKTFGKPIRDYGLVKLKVGQMVIDCYVTEALVDIVAMLTDQGYEDYAVEAAISKVYASEALWRSADEALQIAGGNGYMCEYPYERVLRDARINKIFEGTNEILRLFIALTAMNEVGSQLKELNTTVRGIFDDPIKGFGVLSDYALKHASLMTGIPRAKSKFGTVDAALREPASVFETSTRHLAAAVDRILRKHGRNIIGKQLASRRLANIMIDLFALACTLSRVNSSLIDKGAEGAAREVDILKIFASQVERRVRHSFGLIDINDDELLKGLADHAFDQEKFSWDNI